MTSIIKTNQDEIKQALFAAAKNHFLSEGITATEMKKIAASAGLSRSTLYRYMLDKNQLAFMVAIDVLSEIVEHCISFSTQDATNGYQKLYAFTMHFIDTLCENLQIIRFLSEFDSIFHDAYPDVPEAAEYTAAINRMLHRSAQFLFEGLADGSIAEVEDPLFYISMLTNTIFGLAERMLPRSDLYIKQVNTYPDRILIATATILVESIRAPQ